MEGKIRCGGKGLIDSDTSDDANSQQRVELLSDLKKIADKVKQLKEENKYVIRVIRVQLTLVTF